MEGHCFLDHLSAPCYSDLAFMLPCYSAPPAKLNLCSSASFSSPVPSLVVYLSQVLEVLDLSSVSASLPDYCLSCASSCPALCPCPCCLWTIFASPMTDLYNLSDGWTTTHPNRTCSFLRGILTFTSLCMTFPWLLTTLLDCGSSCEVVPVIFMEENLTNQDVYILHQDFLPPHD